MHLITGTLLYFGLWWGALAGGIVATILLAVWIGVCCWPCISHFWNCCVFLQWMFVFNVLLSSLLFGLLALGAAGNQYVIAGFAAAAVAFGTMMGAANCSTPNPYWPPSWPPCRCGP